jgi:hypothetical protein
MSFSDIELLRVLVRLDELRPSDSVGNRQGISHFENGKSVSPPKFEVFLAPIKCKHIKDLSAISAIIQRYTP